MNTDKFRKRPGTTDQGKEYENTLVAFYCINLILNKEVEDFKISSNDDQCGNYDDLVIEVSWKDGLKEHFNIQVKHKQVGKKKNLLMQSLRAENGKFSLKKAIQQYIPSEEKKYYILFTNRKLEAKDDSKILKTETFTMSIVSHQSKSDIINTANSSQNVVYRFNIEPNEAHKEIEKYQSFSEKFYLYTDQKNVKEIREKIFTLFRDQFECQSNSIENYLSFISSWCNKDGKKNKLTKELILVKLTEFLLSSFILAPSESEISEKSELIKKAIDLFEVTYIESHNEPDANFYRIKKDSIELIHLNRTGIKYQILKAFVKNASELSTTQYALLLWMLNKSPLILQVSEDNKLSVSQIISHIGVGKKFIFLGNCPQLKNPFQTCFQNLSDVFHYNKETYHAIVKTFNCSFNGQKNTNLEEIIEDDENIRQEFTTQELVSMIDDNCNFGTAEEKIPFYYIQRKVSKIAVNYKFVEKLAEDDSVVINCNKKFPVLTDKIQEGNFLIIDETQVDTPLESSADFFNKANIYVAKEQCSSETFAKICAQNPNSNSCHLFQIDEEVNLEWLSSSSIKELQLEEVFIKEKHLAFIKGLNLICAEAGMGKSAMMINFKQNSSCKVWILRIVLRENLPFLENSDINSFLVELSSKKDLSPFENRLFSQFLKLKKVVFVWDGLDEVGRETLDNVLKIIKILNEKGFTQWITARPNMRKTLEKSFNTFARTIKPFDKEDQKQYIMERFHGLADLEKVTTQMLKQISNEHLAVPLQIFMLTELYHKNTSLCNKLLTNTFSITDLFEFFIEEKFNFFYEKANFDLNNNIAQRIIDEHKRQRLENYKAAALNLLLPKSILAKFDVQNVNNFLSCIEKEGDSFGIMEVRNRQVNFSHGTYGEYFVALWLSENHNKIKEIQHHFFEEAFKEIRFMFDLIMAKNCPLHIGVLNKSLEATKEHIDKIRDIDQVGRTPIHVALSWGKKHPLLNAQNGKNKVTIRTENVLLVKNHKVKSDEIFEFLAKKSNLVIDEKDNLFKFNAIQYADSNLSLGLLEVVAKYKPISFSSLENFKDTASVLYYVVKFGYLNLLKTITEIPYVETTSQNSLLHLCAAFNRTEILQKLLQEQTYKNSINKRDKKNWGPIHYAVYFGHLDIVKFFKKSGCDLQLGSKDGKDTPLFLAARHAQKKILLYLLKNKSNVNVAKRNGWTPLLIACSKKDFEAVKILVEYKADVNKANNCGYTPLYVAARKGDLRTLKFLFSKGANINSVGKSGESPLYIAAKLGYEKVVQFLIAKKADVNTRKTNGWTPLVVAIGYKQNQIVKLLLNCKMVDTLSVKKNGKDISPLQQAVSSDNLEAVEMLLQDKVKIELTAFKIALGKSDAKILNLLSENLENFELDTFLKSCEEKKEDDTEVSRKQIKKTVVVVIFILLLLVIVLGGSVLLSYVMNVKSK